MPKLDCPQNFRFALVDIETTGGKPTYDSITEIAVITMDQSGELSRWQTLVQPNCFIPIYIQELTGISNEMVAGAPRFKEIAEELLAILEGCIFVAHNARFDYGFIKNHFSRLGINFQSKVLCSVRLSRKLFPQYKSHSMDRLIEHHNLQPISRHRAMGDADLIKQFLDVCYDKFGMDNVFTYVKQLIKQSSLPSELETNINNIPQTPGVYSFYNDKDHLPIYIGKSVNLRARVMSHFTSDYKSTKEMNIKTQIRHIEYIETAGELGALLLESKLIKEKLPVYNRRLRKNKLTCGFIKEQNAAGYLSIKIQPLIQLEQLAEEGHTNIPESFGAFKSKTNAILHLEELITKYSLCPKLCGLDRSKKSCFAFQLKQCKGACLQQEPAVLYNLRVEMALLKYRTIVWPYEGRIGVREYCSENGLEDIHVFDNWRHLGTIRDPSELDMWSGSISQPLQHNWDEVKIIQKFLLTKIKKDQIIKIRQGARSEFDTSNET